MATQAVSSTARLTGRMDLLAGQLAKSAPDVAVAAIRDDLARHSQDDLEPVYGSNDPHLVHAVLLIWSVLGPNLTARWASEPVARLDGLSPVQWMEAGGDSGAVLLAAGAYLGEPAYHRKERA